MPTLQHRLFWTWDYSTNWGPAAAVPQNDTWNDPEYGRHTEDFLQDYKNLVDFCVAHGFTGIIIYGFLRDSHGGIKAAQELCRYGRQKNVGIIPGIGVFSYGGVYWEGNHEFNLPSWLERHPHLAAVGQPPSMPCFIMACPSKEENLKWMRESVRWLSETIDIDGINFETGDYGVCQCDDCRRRSTRTGRWSFADIGEVLPPLVEEMLQVKPKTLPLCECYFDNVLETEEMAPLRLFPPGAILQFTINRK